MMRTILGVFFWLQPVLRNAASFLSPQGTLECGSLLPLSKTRQTPFFQVLF
jgi:hypothetical protein